MVYVDLLDDVRNLGLGGSHAERIHDSGEFIGGDGAGGVLVEECKGIMIFGAFFLGL